MTGKQGKGSEELADILKAFRDISPYPKPFEPNANKWSKIFRANRDAELEKVIVYITQNYISKTEVLEALESGRLTLSADIHNLEGHEEAVEQIRQALPSIRKEDR